NGKGGPPGSPPGGNRSVPDFGFGNPFSNSSLTKASNFHVPGIANGKGLSKHGLALDLASSQATIVLDSKFMQGAKTVTINVNGTNQTFISKQVVTPAEFVAILQVLNNGSQTLMLASNGSADGGNFSFNGLISPRITLLVVPASVTAFDYF